MKTNQINGLVAALGLIALSLFTASCQKEVSTGAKSGQTSVKIFLTDDQSLVFDQVLIDIRKLEIKVEDSAEVEHEMENETESEQHDRNGETSGGWMTVTIRPGIYDILKFRNGADTLFGVASFPANRSIRKLRLTLGDNNSAVYQGNNVPLTLKDKEHIVVIKLHELEIESTPNNETSFWVDFDASRSIRQKGSAFELKPELKTFRKEKSGGIEGRVLPAAANAFVYAINGLDTVSAKPEREGEFKIMGLKAGTYSLLVHATANNYADKTLSGIIVQNKEDAHVGTITLTP